MRRWTSIGGSGRGAAEVIYGAGKTAEQITGIASAMLKNHISTVLITRMDAEKAAKVAETLPLDYHPDARIGIPRPHPGSLPAWAVSWWLPAGPPTFPWPRKPALTAEVPRQPGGPAL